MALSKAMYNGVEEIMGAYDRNCQTPYFSVWCGRDMVFSYNDDDNEKGRNHLLENLMACEQNGHQDILKIKFHPVKEKNYITDKTPSISTLFVRVCRYEDARLIGATNMQVINENRYNNQISQLLEKQSEMLSGIHNRLALLEEEEEEQEEQQGQAERILGTINGLLDNPLITILLSKLVPDLSSLVKNQVQPVTQLAGIETQYDINIALQRLDNHVNNLPEVLTKLANYADNNTKQFHSLITML